LFIRFVLIKALDDSVSAKYANIIFQNKSKTAEMKESETQPSQSYYMAGKL